MLRMLVGTVLAGALVAARAAADMMPYDPATGKAIDGAAVLLDLDKYPDYTFLFLDGGCFSTEHFDDDELAQRHRRKVGDERLGCGYQVVGPGVGYKGVSHEAPNADSGEFLALPAKRFPVTGGKVPALDGLLFGTLVAWRDGGSGSPLVALGSPPDFVELHRFSERVGFTDYLRVSSPCGAPRLQLVRREWQLENGEVIVQAQPATTPSCDPAPAVPEDRGEGADVVAPEPVAVAEPVVAPVPASTPVATASAVSGSVQAPAARPDAPSAAPEDRFGARELVLGGVCLLVGLGSGLALRRRRAR